MRLYVLTAMLIAAAAPSLGGAHDWYTGLRSPTGIECCGERDSRPAGISDEAWRPVEYDKVLPFPSPDGGAHACWGDPWGGKKPAFRCIILPGTAALDRPEGVVTLDGAPPPGVR